jgi:glc operon protein GlcG
MGSLGLGRRLQLVIEMADKVIHEAERMGADVAVVAVDRGGREILSYRSDLCAYTATEPARRKATTAAAIGAPTSFVASAMGGDPVAMQALASSPDMLAAPGGFPIIQDNIVIGGIGLSGGHYSQDHQILAKALVKIGDLPAAMFSMGPPPGAPSQGAGTPLPGAALPPGGGN